MRNQQLFFASLIWLVIGCIHRMQPASVEQPATSTTPVTQIQEQFRLFEQAKTADDHFLAARNLTNLKIHSQASNEQWVEQMLLSLRQSHDDPSTSSWLRSLKTVEFSRSLGLTAADYVRALTPYLDNADPVIVDLARELMDFAEVFRPEITARYTDPPPTFDSVKAYLEERGKSDPPWKLVQMMYRHDADVAFNTAMEIYLDASTRHLRECDQKELQILIASRELAFMQRKPEEMPEIERKIMAKLTEMAHTREWCVRMYALEILDDLNWIHDSTLVRRLAEDENRMIAACAKEVLSSSNYRWRGN
jgi:hypothetical protein